MDILDNEYKNYWETNMFLQSEELDSCYLEEAAFSGYYDSSSPEGTASKNIVSERNRRKKLNQKLYALRSVVPNITKMDKASIIKDAIAYIQSLHDEENKIKAEISELESAGQLPYSSDCWNNNNNNNNNNNWSNKPVKRTRVDGNSSNSSGSGLVHVASPIEVLELRVLTMEKGIVVVSLTCCKRSSDTMVRLCEIFESLNLKIITSNIYTFSGKIVKTVFLQADEDEKNVARLKIEDAIAIMNGPDSPMSI